MSINTLLHSNVSGLVCFTTILAHGIWESTVVTSYLCSYAAVHSCRYTPGGLQSIVENVG